PCAAMPMSRDAPGPVYDLGAAIVTVEADLADQEPDLPRAGHLRAAPVLRGTCRRPSRACRRFRPRRRRIARPRGWPASGSPVSALPRGALRGRARGAAGRVTPAPNAVGRPA